MVAPALNAPQSPREQGSSAPSGPRRLFASLGPDFTILLFFIVLLGVIGRVFGAHYKVRLSTMLLPGLAAPGIILVRLASQWRTLRRNRADARSASWNLIRETVRDWLPLVLVATVFDNLEDYTGIIRKIPIDERLYKLDLAIFGVEPTVAIARLYHPLLTDWMAFCYGIFFIIPMALGIALCLRGRGQQFREMATSVMLQMWLGFFLFICFPAGPPRYFPPLHDGPFRTAIPSLLGINDYLQGTWDTYDPLLVRSAFPSLHCAYGLMTLIYAWRFGDGIFRAHKRLFFWLVLPLELSLFASTVYLRHHWIPDMAVGWTISIISCSLAPWLWRYWPRPAVVRA